MDTVKKPHDADGPSNHRCPAPDSEGAGTEFGVCSVCGSPLAANGHCPDCGAPGEEPEGLDDYAFSEAESSRPASSHCAPAAQTSAGDEGRVGPASAVAEPSVPRMTLAELWAEGADHHHALTPERARDLLDIVSEVSAGRGEARPPRLDWLRRVAGARAAVSRRTLQQPE